MLFVEVMDGSISSRASIPPLVKSSLNCQGTGVSLIRRFMMYHVHNLKEGSRAGNWIKYWEEATGKKAYYCHKVGCMATATDGAHVQLSNSTDRRWYIVPLCHKCNCQFGEEFNVTGPLVSATDPNVILP